MVALQKAAFVVAIGLLPIAGASATTTSCAWRGSTWVCETKEDPWEQLRRAPPPALPPRPAPEQPDRLGESLRALQERNRAENEAAQRARFAKAIGTLLSRGRCDDAIAMAVYSGDASLMDITARACRK
jgi:hypothetical protein